MSELSTDQNVADGSYTVRAYNSDDRAAFLSLYEAVWGTSKNTDWFDWRYEGNPYHSDIKMVVAECDGELVGAEPLLPMRLRARDEEVFAFQPADWMVHPDHRRRGLSSRMTEWLLETLTQDAVVLFNFPTDPLLAGLEKFDWVPVGTVSYSYRIQRPSALVTAAARNRDVPTVAARATNATDPLVRGYQTVKDHLWRCSTNVTVERHATLPAAAFVEAYETSPPASIHVARDEAFYQWRFSNPEWETNFYFASLDGEPIAGAVVMEEQMKGVNRVNILDIQPVNLNAETTEAVEALIRAVIKEHRDADVLKIADSGQLHRVLGRLGFKPSDSLSLSLFAPVTNFATRPIPLDDDAVRFIGGMDIGNWDNWSIQLADQHLG